MKKVEPDTVFVLAGEKDPFTSDNLYLRAFMQLEPIDRRRIARQVILICATVEGLDPLGALELLAAISPYLRGDPSQTG